MSAQPPTSKRTSKRSLAGRLAAGPVICAQGFLFEMERRGYMQAGAFVPEVVLEHPEALAQFHRELVRAGSDVVEAFTYYAHREKLRLIGKEDWLEPLNRRALELAHEVAAEVEGEPPLVAGNISNSNVYEPENDAAEDEVRGMFAEQARWAAAGGADFVIGETFYYAGEARLALEAIRDVGLPAVVTLALPAQGTLLDGHGAEETCRLLEGEGAAVVGLNCFRGPATMLPVLARIREAVSGPVAALPVPYRTTERHPTFLSLPDPGADALPDGRTFPVALEPLQTNRFEVAEFTRQARDLGIEYLGLCCGAAPHFVRAMAEALGRTPPASRYSPDMSKHFAFGNDPALHRHLLDAGGQL